MLVRLASTCFESKPRLSPSLSFSLFFFFSSLVSCSLLSCSLLFHNGSIQACYFALGRRCRRRNWCRHSKCPGVSARHVKPRPLFCLCRIFVEVRVCTNLHACNSVKTRLQVQVRPSGEKADSDADAIHYTSTWNAISRIVADEGIQGLYAGMNGSLVGVASTNFAYFYWYTVARALYLKSAGPAAAPSTAIELSLGAAAGALAQLFTIPVAVVTTRQQTAAKADRKGLLATAQEVIEGPDGVSGLWRGLKASLVLVVNPAITYGAYERLKDVFFHGKTKLKPWEAFRKLLYIKFTFAVSNNVKSWVPCPKRWRPSLHSP